MTDTITYSNPRLDAVIPDWPTGKYKTEAHFWIETDPKRGQRAVRTTKHPITGKVAAPHKLTYALLARIVDGSDGRTYIANQTVWAISIMCGDMKFQQEWIPMEDSRYSTVKALFS